MRTATQPAVRKPRAAAPRPKVRRTNAERTAIAQRKLIDAALKTLYLEGYQATTTDLVDTSFAREPLIEEPVTSGADSILWECDVDGDGDCDGDDRNG